MDLEKTRQEKAILEDLYPLPIYEEHAYDGSCPKMSICHSYNFSKLD